MALSSGSTLSHYRLVQPLGQGGMGVVWRASDSSLGRDVAIKVLPDLFASDPERLARLEREARLLAALNHPHIASVYGLHTEGSIRFLAMELVEGQDLEERLAAGPLPLAEALQIAHQIALAVEHAHERGIVHRDLKPANVRLTTDDQVKVLDFGLAKVLEDEPTSDDSSTMMQHSPTITGRLTGAHVLIGTAAYMAPEQARGRAADRRADIWAFGVVLMEMITGRRLFQGETISDTLASVLKSDPDWSTLPAGTPPRIQLLLKRCLDRDPQRRLRDIGEARITLEDAIRGAPDEPTPSAIPAPRRGLLRPLVFAAVGLLAGAVLTGILARLTAPPANEIPFRRYHLTLPEPEAEAGRPADASISPDGRTMAYRLGEQLWIQALDELEPKRLVSEPGIGKPFWSPDGQYLGFLSGTRIMKVPVGGGGGQLICDTRESLVSGSGVGASWGENDLIVFSHAESTGIQGVPAHGGDPRTILRPDSTESDLHEPHVLPGGRGILFCAHTRGAGIDNIGLWTGEERRLLLHLPEHTLSTPVYSPTGHILYRRNAPTPGIWALPFSLSRLEATGEPFLVAENSFAPSVSRDGTLGYLIGASSDLTQLVWVDRAGVELGPIGELRQSTVLNVSLSPDGQRVARRETEGENGDIWIYDLGRGTRSRFTFDPGIEEGVSWSPDGSRIAYHAAPDKCLEWECWHVLVRAANGTGVADSIGPGAWPSYSPDGRYLTFAGIHPEYVAIDLMAVDLQGDRTPFRVIAGNPRAMGAAVAPNGSYVAYIANESGRWEVYLSRFPGGEGKWQISAAGGQWPCWNAAGDRLYFAQGDEIMEVEVGFTETAPVLGTPRRLFARPPLGALTFELVRQFAVTGDGSRFVVMRTGDGNGAVRGVAVAQNWFRSFQAR